MVKDPYTLFTYWYVPKRKRATVERHYQTDWNELTKAVQIYKAEPSTNSEYSPSKYNPVSLHIVELNASSLYIHSVEPSRFYIAEYGIISETQTFVPFVRSEVIQTPYLHSLRSPTTLQQTVTPSQGMSNIQKENEYESPFTTFSSYTLYTNREGV